MTESLPNRPAGGREGDFSELNDWTITDIATTPKTAPEDRANAEAEIARREEAGIYNPDEAPQEVRSDLLSHGYSVEDGRILYPKPEYKSWLESDRKEPIPQGVVRESIADRLEAEKREAAEAHEVMNDEYRREFNRVAGEAAIRAFEDFPAREKIDHPSRTITKRNEVARERRAEERATDIEFAERRRMKEFNKYDNSFLNSEKIAASEARANLPLVEMASQPSEYIREPESADVRAERLYKLYEKEFSKNAPRWVSFGVSSLLEKGIVDPPTNSLLRSGFSAREEDRIHERIDPDDTFSPEAAKVEGKLKTRVEQDLIEKGTEAISEDDLRRAKRDGIMYAISSGARTNRQSGKIFFSIPLDQSEKVASFMAENEVDPNSDFVRKASFDGFVNVIEAIKNNKKMTPEGFRALDWYFDTFNYSKDFTKSDGALDILYGYSSTSDVAWSQKLDEYLQTRPEYTSLQEEVDQQNQPENDAVAQDEVSLVSEDDYRKQVADALNIDLEDLKKAETSVTYILDKVLPPEPTNVSANHDGNNRKTARYPRTFGKLKNMAIYATYTLLKESGRDSGVEVFQEKERKIGGEKYTILRFGCKNDEGTIEENHAIAEGESPTSATYMWHGQGEDGWKVFINRYKSEVKKFPGVSSRNHNHNVHPADHMVEIMASFGIDLRAIANKYRESLKQEKVS